MNKRTHFSRLSALIMASIVAVTGLCFMLIINAKTAKAEEAANIVYDAPGAGMSNVLDHYMQSKGESSVDLLTTTAVAASGGQNMYYDEDGSSVGRLVVCTNKDYSPVYLIKDEMSGMYGKLYKNSVATLISVEDDWCKIVSDGISGYVKTEDLAFGKEAEALDGETYVTTALVDTDELTLRKDQSMWATALCILAPQSEHTVVEEDDGSGWTKIAVDGVGEGYVLTEYLAITTEHRYGITLDKENFEEMLIADGVTEAESREAYWAEQAAAEEAARIEAEEEAARIAAEEEEARAAAEAAAAEEGYYEEEEAYYEDSYDDGYYEDSYSDDDYYYDDSSDDYYYDDSDDYYYEEPEYYPEPDTSGSEADAIRQALVDYACSFAGWLPYVSGGNSLVYGADCSGFTSSIYAAFGYTIPRGSDAQAYCGRSVPLSDIKLGDIIIYSGHVAIYAGNGLKVHSPYPGQTVTVNSMYYMTILDVRRVIE